MQYKAQGAGMKISAPCVLVNNLVFDRYKHKPPHEAIYKKRIHGIGSRPIA